MQIAYDPAGPTLGPHPSQTVVGEDTHTQTCVTVSKSQDMKKPECPGKDERKRGTLFEGNIEGNVTQHQKKQVIPFAGTKKDLAMIVLGEVSQKEEDNIQYH